MSLQADLHKSFSEALSSSEKSTADHSAIAEAMASAMAEAISECIKTGVLTTTYNGASSSPAGVVASSVVGIGSIDPSTGLGSFQSGLYGLLMNIPGGSSFHSKFASLMTSWYSSSIPTDSYVGTTTPPTPPPLPISGKGLGSITVMPSATASLVTDMLVSPSYTPSTASEGNSFVASAWSSAVIKFLLSGQVLMTGGSSNAGITGSAILSAFV